MAQETIDKIINIQFKYGDLVNGWAQASQAIAEANAKLKEFKEAGNAEGVAKQTQLIKALRTEMNQYTREIQANVREEVKAEGSINQLNAKIAKLTAQYNAMSGEIRKSAVGEALAKEIAEVQLEVNKANEAVLNFRNNVGNYASAAKGFAPLTLQVQQIARELPSLTMSFSQFFLAISNNLPMFADELQRAKTANDALKKSGAATIPVFKQVVSSIFSWQTALVVGITLLSAYGSEIVDWIKGLFSAGDTIEETTKFLQDLNSTVEKSRLELDQEFEALQNAEKGTKEYAAARKTIEDKYGDYLANQREEIRNLTDQKAAYDALAQSITATAIAKGLEEANQKAIEEYTTALNEAFEGVQKKFITKFGEEQGIAFFTQFRAGITSQEPELRKKAMEIYDLFKLDIPTTMTETYMYAPTNLLSATLDKVTQATDKYNETLTANKIAQESLLDLYGISAEETEKQGEATQDLIKLKQEELARINAEIARTPEEVASRNKRAEAVENEIKRLQELGRARKEYQKTVAKETEDPIAEAVRKQQDAVTKFALSFGKDIDKELARTDKEIAGAFREQLTTQEQIYRNRIATARLEGGDLAAAQEMVNIYKEQLSNLDNLDEAYKAAGYSDLDIQTMRIEARQRVADAENQIARAQEITTQKSFQAAGQLLGALGGLAEATEENAGLAAMLAIAQSAAAMGAALQKAFSKSATVWDGIAGAVAAIATITTVITQIKSLNSSAADEASKYANGGLITGPGTGTSDSIPAMLSNGEAVMTANAVNEWGAMLSAMNVSSGGNAINVSNLPQRGDGMRGMERMMQRVMMNMPSPVVSVVDINKGQRKVKVQDNISKLGRKKYA